MAQRLRFVGRRGVASAAAIAAFAGLGSACTPIPPVASSPISFVEHVVDASVPGASFVRAADALAGGGTELVVSAFGKPLGGAGSVSIYQRGADLDTWTEVPVVTAAAGIKFPNDTTTTDLDGDGDADVVVPAGFFVCAFSGAPCGSLSWWEQTSTGVFTRHDVVSPGNDYTFHRAVVVDFDGDGVTDIVTGAETATVGLTVWFKGSVAPGQPRFDPTWRTIATAGGSLPAVADVDGDGDLDVASPSFFGGQYYFWLERTAEPSISNPAGTFVFHLFNASVGGGFGLALVPDLQGDGVARWIGTNHVNPLYNGNNPPAALFRFDVPADPTQPWAAVPLSSGITSRPVPNLQSPGVFGHGDIDGDGDLDVAVSGDGDERVFWLRQEPDHSFTTFEVDNAMGQAGGGIVADFDGNGTNEMVFSSYEQDRVVVYSR